jgi:hypothetical protein
MLGTTSTTTPLVGSLVHKKHDFKCANGTMNTIENIMPSILVRMPIIQFFYVGRSLGNGALHLKIK